MAGPGLGAGAGFRGPAAAGRTGRADIAAREPAEEFTGLPEQHVQGLEDSDARVLLGSFLRASLDEQVSEWILAEMRGNPLALVELPRGLTAETGGRV